MGFLILEDGTTFEVNLFGAGEKVIGEVVFSTGMSGYQELLTDPSFYGQIVVMTFPLVGNYGINPLDRQSDAPQVRGFVVREACRQPSHWLAQETLQDYLRRHHITAAEGIDTRALTRKLREKGTMTGMLTPDVPTPEDFLALQAYQPERPVPQVTTREVYTIPGEGYHLAVLDLGVKQGILDALQRRNCCLTVFPAHTRAADILAVRPDAIVLSNGPGNPKDNPEIVETVKILL
ncbi:MAG TPA: carbamoyl phosphate synthase small subunit, partial [Clostridia bacterium]|nr:carbamoyl phosphate synthase small subunit [Clostridia bacterium]